MGQGLNWRLGFWAVAGLALLAPLVATQMTSEANWGPGDFLAAALLLTGLGLGVELAVRLLRTDLQRWLATGGLALTAALIWAELAVGIFH
jgi:hypothetical protein